jgi:membrane protease subunit HflK
MLRRHQERLRDWRFNFGGGRGLSALAAAIVLLWAATGIYRVDPNEQAVIQRFGAYVRTESLGLHYHLPGPIETVTFVDVTNSHQTEIGSRTIGSPDAEMMLTGDSNIVDLDFVVWWQVQDPVKYLFRVADPVELLQRASESAMREVIGQTDVQHALNEGRGQIEASSAAILQSTLDRYNSGIHIASIQLQRIDPPQPVVEAFHDVQVARADLERQRNEAEAYANKIVPEARGMAQKLIQDANGYKGATIADANGEAQQFVSVLDAYQKARDVTARRMYIDTMQAILQKSRKIIIEPNANGSAGVIPYLPLPSLSAPPQPAGRGQ